MLYSMHVLIVHIVYVVHKALIHALYEDPWIAQYQRCKAWIYAKRGFGQVKRGYDSIAPLPSFAFSMKFC